MKKVSALSILFVAVAVTILTYQILIPSDDEVDLDKLSQSPTLSFAEIAQIKDKDSASKAWRTRLDLSLDQESRISAIKAAGKFQSLPATPILDTIVGDPNSPLAERLLAAETLSRIAPRRDCPGLEAGLKSTVPELRLACAEALVRTGQPDLGIKQLFNHVLLKETRKQALLRLRRLTHQRFPVDNKAGPLKSNQQLALWKDWWGKNKEHYSPPPYH